MKIAIAQINTSVGDISGNTKKIIENITKAYFQKADLVIFPECTTTGYPQKDILFDLSFLERNNEALDQIYKNLPDGLVTIIGCVTFDGGSLRNSAAIMEKGKDILFQDKRLLPNYNVFDERRYFEPCQYSTVSEIKSKLIGVEICEDIWDDDYEIKPTKLIAKQCADFIVVISASPYSNNKINLRKNILKRRFEEFKVPIIYVNQVGGQDGLIFDGGSMIIDKKHIESIQICKRFEEDFQIIEFNSETKTFEEMPLICEISEIHSIYQALILGIKDYFLKTGFSKAVIGLSGGIDSALVAALATEALGKENVVGILMPSVYSSTHSVSDALKLADNLEIDRHIFTIGGPQDGIVGEIEKTIIYKFEKDVTEQNIQARVRGILLMAFSNEFGHLVLSTGNKSELSVGYCTLYGDMVGGLSVIADVYKTTVYELAHHFNAIHRKAIIPENTINKVPSAELKPGQKDTDSLPPYEILDEILKSYIERKQSKVDIIQKCKVIFPEFESSNIEKVIKMVNNNEYKRQQAAPCLIISERDLNLGRRMPIANRWKG